MKNFTFAATIGIPRALFYWKRPYFWEAFFKNLGCEVILSPQTNKEIVKLGVEISDPETCLSVKVLFGHILWLVGKVDYIFVPRLKTDYEKLEYCPKFFGMPDLAKIITKTPILTETFDEKKEDIQNPFKKIGERLGKNKQITQKAIAAAFLKEKEWRESEEKDFFEKINSKEPKIILISHQYNLYDEYVNLRMRKKIEDLGAKAILITSVPESKEVIEKDIPNFHWEFGKEIMEKINTIFKYPISGAIEISSFQCGCDAVLKEFVEKRFKSRKIPFLYLLIDEHTGEAGIQTRLEAFFDTLK